MPKITKIKPRMPDFPVRKRVAAYARVSMETERLRHSLSSQISYYSKLIQDNPEWEYVGVYADEGISGTAINKRDEFKRLISDCDAGKIDIILTKSISRFARNTVDLLNTVRHLKEIGVEVRFEKENIWTFDGKGELLITIMPSLAQEESRSISENCTWGQRKRFADGKVTVAFSHFLGYDRGLMENLSSIPNRQKSSRVFIPCSSRALAITASRRGLQIWASRRPAAKINGLSPQ